LDEALRRHASDFRCWHLPEPQLLFARGQGPDPKNGIAMFGAWRPEPEQESQRLIRVGLIGTGETIAAARHWLERCRSQVDPDPDSADDPVLFPTFPGIETSAAFNCRLEFSANLTETFTPAEVAQCTGAPNRDLAVRRMGEVLQERFAALAEKDIRPDVIVIALTDEIRNAAGSGRSPPRRRAPVTTSRQLTMTFMDRQDDDEAELSRTLHRVIKGIGMRFGIPTQLSWPGNFRGGSEVEDDATRAWNFCTALYYKAGGIPWRATGLAKNTCYIGISFYRPISESGTLQTSMAQAFSDRGDGLVLRGESFEWDIRKLGAPRMSKESARKLLASTLAHYETHLRQKPMRVVLHKSSEFGAEEVDGFKEALADIPFFDFLSIRRSSTRFMRAGNEPPIRGTAIEIAPKRFVVYSRGYIPYLRVYPGLRIPRPLLITQHDGAGGITELLPELLALTKLNWNSAAFARSEPITLGFSRTVGLILSELSPDIVPQTSYRFYM
jgi:hypothetical protein